jgi:hypothetical protein
LTRPSPAIDPEVLLSLIPGQNQAIRVDLCDQGLIVWTKIRRRWWMGPPLGWFLPFRSEKGVALDVLGREVFEACDGQRSLERIIEQFAVRHRLRFQEARISVTTFLRWLVERKIVYLARGRDSI